MTQEEGRSGRRRGFTGRGLLGASGLAWASAAALACGGGTIRESRGGAFELNGQESSLADQYERQEPKQADMQTRCQYWQGKAMDARRPHQIGVLVWQGTHFANLQTWADSRAQETCGEARLDRVQARLPPVLTAKAQDSVIDVFLTKANRPLPNETVTLTVGPGPGSAGGRGRQAGAASAQSQVGLDRQLTLNTGDDGHAAFDLSSLQAGPDIAQLPMALIRHPGASDVTVNLSSSPVAAKWKADVAAAQVAQQVQINKAACGSAQKLNDLRSCAAMLVKAEGQGDEAKAEILDVATKAYARVFDATEAALNQACKANPDVCASASDLVVGQLTQAQPLIVGTLPVLPDAALRIARIQRAAETARQERAASLKQAQVAQHQREAQQEVEQRRARCASTCASACAADAHCRSECVAEKCNN